jgi:hypothetical protein
MALPYESQYKNIIKKPQKGSAEYGKVEKDAGQEYADRMRAIDQRIKQVQALRESDMSSVRRNADLAQRDVNDQMFREYLASKESMGGRGVANSGLMADAQIRLNANKQDRIAELYNKTQDKLGDVNRTYAPEQTQLLGERAGVRKSKVFQEMYDKLLEQRSREAGLLQPLVQNEFTNEQRKKGEAFQSTQAQKEMDFKKGESELERAFRLEEAEKERESELSITKLRIAAEQEEGLANREADAAEGLANRKSSEQQSWSDRKLERDKIKWEKEKAELIQTAEGRTKLSEEYNKQADSYQASASDLSASIGSEELTPEERNEVIKLRTIEKLKEQRARDLAAAYALNDKIRLNQAIYLYNKDVLGLDTYGMPIK